MKTIQDYPFFADIPAKTYHEEARAGKYLSSHLLGDFRHCPRLYRQKMTGEIPPQDTAAYWMGRAVHTLVCEGRAAFDKEFLVTDGPVNPKTEEPFGKLTRAYKEWAAAQKLTPVSTSDFGFMTKLQSAVWLHPIAGELLDGGWAEGTVRTTYNGEPVQIRIDYFNPNFRDELTGREGAIIDLKTCESIDFFESDARRYGYLHQLAFYREVMRIASGEESSPCTSSRSRRRPRTASACGSSPPRRWTTRRRTTNAPFRFCASAAARTAGRPATRRCASSTSTAETHHQHNRKAQTCRLSVQSRKAARRSRPAS